MDIITTIEYITGSSFRHIRTSTSKLFCASLVLLGVLVYLNGAALFAQQFSEHASATPVTLKPTASSATMTPQPVAQQPDTTPQAATAISTSVCTPATYALPGALDLIGTSGLTETVEPTQTYSIYGVNGAELRQQIQACAPRERSGDAVAEFTAQTGYYLSWQYDYAMRGDGLCTVANPRVGLHVAMILPDWQPSTDADRSLVTKWRTFIENLTVHENGHVNLDREYARQMFADLQSFPASSCDTIQQSVNAIMQNNIVRLNIANDQYDAATNHGATQGAVIPQ
ncbi:DUF922 domain-containing protein [Candidatus Saccharibacteria bacterium]|nr:MAG: DUF922 domain-containing protein [Candidatus Saccharibacteria bacterium]